jgi:hypothetical protein
MTPIQADRLADSIGLNIKPEDFGRSYDLYWDSVVIPELVASGIRHVRVGIEPPSGDSAAHKATYFRRLSQLGSLGVRLSVVTTQNFNPAKLDPDWVSGGQSWSSIEAANEPNLADGAWYVGTRAYQQLLWDAVQNDQLVGPAGANVHVCGPGLTGGGWAPLGDISPWCRFGNMHPYYPGMYPETGTLAAYLKNAKVVYGTRPVIATEMGWTESLGQHDIAAVAPAIIAQYVPRLFLWNLMQGVPRTYYYQMMNDRPPNPSDPEAGFGLINNNGTMTSRWNNLKLLAQMFSDPGPDFMPRTVAVGVTGGNGSIKSMLFQKRDGTNLLAFWLGVSSWNPVQYAIIVVPDQAVTISLPPSATRATMFRFSADGRLSAAAVSPVNGMFPAMASVDLKVLTFRT